MSLGDEIPEIDIELMATKSLLIDGEYYARTMSCVSTIIIASGKRSKFWSYAMNRGGFFTAVLDLFELDLWERRSESWNERPGGREILTSASMRLLS